MSQLQMFHATRDLVSTVDPAHFAKWSGMANYVGRYVISVISAVELMRMGPFDFINIDTEGTSAAIGLFLLETMYEIGLCRRCCASSMTSDRWICCARVPCVATGRFSRMPRT